MLCEPVEQGHRDTLSLLSVMVTGPLRKQVLVRRALLGRVVAELYRGSLKIGLRPAEGRPEADFEAFPDRVRPKLGPKVPSSCKLAVLGVRSP